MAGMASQHTPADLVAVIDTVWPAESHSAATRAKRAAASRLLQPPHWALLTVVEAVVHQQLGDLTNLGITKQLRDLLMEDRHFQVERGAEAALLVRLDVSKLSKLGKSSQWWQKPVPAAPTAETVAAEEQAEAAVAAAAAGAALFGMLEDLQQQMHRPAVPVVSSNGLLAFVAGRKWHQSNGFIHAARHHLAVSIVNVANKAKFSGPNQGKGAAAAEPARYSVPLATAAKWMVRGVKKALNMDIQPEGTAWVARALAGDPYLRLVAGPNNAAHDDSSAASSSSSSSRVKLDINEVLWDIVNGRDASVRLARAAAAAAAAGLSGSGGGSGDGTLAAAATVQQDATTTAAAAVSAPQRTTSNTAAAEEQRFGFLQQQREHAADDDDCISINSDSTTGSVHVGADYVDEFDFDDVSVNMLYKGLTGMPLQEVEQSKPEVTAGRNSTSTGNSGAAAAAAAGEAFAAAAASLMPPQRAAAAKARSEQVESAVARSLAGVGSIAASRSGSSSSARIPAAAGGSSSSNGLSKQRAVQQQQPQSQLLQTSAGISPVKQPGRQQQQVNPPARLPEWQQKQQQRQQQVQQQQQQQPPVTRQPPLQQRMAGVTPAAAGSPLALRQQRMAGIAAAGADSAQPLSPSAAAVVPAAAPAAAESPLAQRSLQRQPAAAASQPQQRPQQQQQQQQQQQGQTLKQKLATWQQQQQQQMSSQQQPGSQSAESAVGEQPCAATKGCAALAASIAAAAAPGQATAPQLLFTVAMQQLPGGWFLPYYTASEDEQSLLSRSSSSSGDGRRAAAAAAGALAGIGASSRHNSSSAGLTQLQGSSVQAAGAAGAAAGSCSVPGVIEVLDDVSSVLPPWLVTSHLQPYLSPASGSPSLLELAADIGRPVRLRLSDGQLVQLADTQLNMQEQVKFLWEFQQSFRQLQQQHGQAAALSSYKTANQNSSSSSSSSGDPFGPDSCTGVEGTLHRIAAVRDKSGAVTGLSYRVGRHVPGVAMLLADVLSSLKASTICPKPLNLNPGLNPSLEPEPEPEQEVQLPRSLLLLGHKGVGKTALLRDIARVISLPVDQGGLGLAVTLVDTYCDIAGDAELPHKALGAARRVVVPQRLQQGSVMLQAARNHCLDVMIVDELATAEDVAAAVLLAQKGVTIVAAAPASSLTALLHTPELQLLLGVTGGLIPQRSGPAAFASVLEMTQQTRWRLHPDAEASADALLSTPNGSTWCSRQRGQQQRQMILHTQWRSWDQLARMTVQFETAAAAQEAVAAAEDLVALAAKTKPSAALSN